MPVFGSAFDQASVYWVLALAGTALFIIKIVLLLIGGDMDAHADLDFHADIGGDAHIDHASSGNFAVFSLQSILAFFMGVGWMGLAALKTWGLGGFAALLLALGFGVTLMMLNAGLMFAVSKLNQETTYDLKTAIGHIGKVYLVVPEKGEGMGQVEMDVSGRRMVLKAVSETAKISSEAMVVVTDVRDDQILVVREQK